MGKRSLPVEHELTMTAPPVIVAIETSQRRGGVAVRDAAGRVHAETLATDLRHDDDLLPAIERLYARAGLVPQDTAAVGVSLGPGGFTGLRIGIATAKLLGEVLGAALVGIPSALVVAEVQAGPGPIIVALAAKGASVWATRLEREGEAWSSTGDGALVERLDLVGVRAVVADEHLLPALRRACADAGVPVVAPSFDPRCCLAVASRRLARGLTVEPVDLLPLYPRPPAVTLPTPRL